MMMQIRYTNLLILALLFVSSCYIDDSTPPNPDRLPFENFDEFFADNNEAFESYLFYAEDEVNYGINASLSLLIPDSAIELDDSIQMDVVTAFTKSDHILLNKPTVSGSTILESYGAFNVQMISLQGALNFDNPISAKFAIETSVLLENLSYYYLDNDWIKDETIVIEENANALITCESTEAGWQMLAKEFDVSEQVEMTFIPSGYGTIPLDIRAFAVLDDHKVIIDLETDVDAVTVNGTLPKDVPLTIVVLIMDNFKLSIGTLNTTLATAGTMDLDVDILPLEEVIEIIKNLDE